MLNRVLKRRPTPFAAQRSLSLFFRENRESIESGFVPPRYSRVADAVSGDRVLEMGAAEGTLALLLAQRKRFVIGIEPQPERASLAVQRIGAAQPPVKNVSFVFGDIRDHLPLLSLVDAFVGMRCIYYLRADTEAVFDAIAASVPEVVLTGNAEREKRFMAGERSNLGEFERYATLDGMVELLESRGYRIVRCESGVPRERDPMVIARAD
jgi:SAM-dependent methyltransferase